MELPHADVDPGGLLEYSVVFTDRSLNHMSQRFIGVMQDIVDVLRTTHHAEGVAVVPGGGTYAMEAVARQLVTGRRVLAIRTGSAPRTPVAPGWPSAPASSRTAGPRSSRPGR